MTSPRYLIGIDLGTTNTVVAYSEIQDELQNCVTNIFEIDQLIGPGEVVRKPLLPSFRYHPADEQIAPADRILPWTDQHVSGDIENVVIGEWAKALGAKVEGRQVSSAKSWLSHPNADRSADILPWSGTQDVEKVSPVVASASYLNHVKCSWNYHHPNDRLEHQQVVVTIPASFDEAARNLTLDACKLAGLNDILLLEEPQAVFYDWYNRHTDSATQELADVPLVLVCDVGGGTTDLSLIHANIANDELQLKRVGVGEHLMLGGDNIDLALAHLSEQQLHAGKKLSAASLSKLIQQTRRAKESLLSSSAPSEAKITMLGGGSKLIGGSKSALLTKEEVHKVVLEGFFPLTELNDLPNKRRSAVVEFGLPYVSDPAISKHIAEFLFNHQTVCQSILQSDDGTQSNVPVGVLFNGGVFNSELIADQMSTLFSNWRGATIQVLNNPHPDWSVAYGAVAFGKARMGALSKIGGGAARSYFLHLQEKNKSSKALCLLAKGTEEGQEIRLSGRRFSLTLGEPVRFNLLTSTHDQLTDATGSTSSATQNGIMVDINTEQFNALPPYVSTLDSDGTTELSANEKERVEVILATQLTEVGTLKIECVDTNNDAKRWLLEFEVRHQQGHSDPDHSEHPRLHECKEIIQHLYSGNKKTADNKAIKTLTRDLEKRLGKRESWDFHTLRQIFDTLIQGKKRRRRSEAHERNWLRLAGYSLRPGFGDATDSWRIEHVWPLYQQGIQFTDHQSWTDWWVFWRRISGGLTQDQQETILADIAKYLHPGAMKSAKNAKEVQSKGYEAMVRLAASLEKLHVEDKELLASWFFSKAINHKQFNQAHWWALGRLAARTPLNGSQHNVIGSTKVQQWLAKLIEQDWTAEPTIGFAAVMMCRKTGDRSLDISEESREQLITKLQQSRMPDSWLELVSKVKELSESESKRVFGEALPSGLRLLQ
ncbi:hsp70 family protein [Vibrio sp. S4M6]|uniref:Hsp70 family protein n=1 Tax=Vibrio sinus TaxID=2946865 RepID=UPI002029F2F3|nr:Hsp70 family protein [Vibrio sinus]MCL9781206.1 hsp70 family protein [Vibrio sinus]